MSSNKKPQNIKVFLRLRPLNEGEIQNRVKTCVHAVSPKELVVKHQDERKYVSDGVLDPKAGQQQVFETVVKPLIAEVLSGYSCTVFAYGQTGSGKTYTIAGVNENNPSRISNMECNDDAGIIIRFFHNLFEEFQLQRLEYTVRASFIEIYNEEIIDLLSSDNSSRIRLFEDQRQKNSVLIHNIEEEIIKNKSQVYELLRHGFAKRHSAATLMNSQSSRSHIVFTATILIREVNENGEELMKMGKINFVDLAGSENAGKSGVVDKRAREAANINTSLLTLGRVISALVQKSSHVPYRESKLTRILQDSLGGQTQTSIIATISPTVCNIDETLSTLDYAIRARCVTNRPEINKSLSKEAMVEQCNKEIEKLKQDLYIAHTGEGRYVNEEYYNKLLSDTEEGKTKLSQQIQITRDIEDRIKEMKIQKINILKNFEQLTTTLEQTSETVEKAEEQMFIDKQRAEEKKKMISMSQNKENAIKKQAELLFNVASSTLGSESILYNKLDTLCFAEENNANVKSKFLSNSTKQNEEVLRKAKNISNNQTRMIASMKQDFEKLDAEFLLAQTFLDTSLKDINRKCESVIKLSQDLPVQTEENAKQVQMQIIATYKKCEDKAKDVMQDFCINDVPNFISKFDELGRNQQRLLMVVNKKTQIIKSYVKESVKEIYEELRTLCKRTNESLIAFEKAMAIQEEDLFDTQHQQKQWELEVENKISMVTDIIAQILESSKRHQCVVSDLNNKHSGTFKILGENNSQLLNVIEEKQKCIASKEHNLKYFVLNSQKDIEDIVDTGHMQTQTIIQDTQSNIKATTLHVQRMDENNKENVKESINNIIHIVREHERSQKEPLLSYNAQFTEQINGIREIVDAANRSEHKVQESMLNYSNIVKENLPSLKDATHREANGIAEQLTEIRAHTGDFKAKYTTVTHKGDTPSRTVRLYPQKIISKTPLVNCRKQIERQIQEEEENNLQ